MGYVVIPQYPLKFLKCKEKGMKTGNEEYIKRLQKDYRECSLFGYRENMRYYKKLLDQELKKVCE